jgi:hypothetical protein
MFKKTKIYSLPNIYLLGSLKNHSFYKTKLLNEINNSPSEPISNIFRCDWGIHRDIKREYQNTLFDNLLTPYFKEVAEILSSSGFEISNYWFQQYEKGSNHDWHIHPRTNYTGVYYIEYPDTTAKTEIYNFLTKDKLKLEHIEEGDVLIFPSNLVHRAPKITDNQRKTIVSFNMDFLYFDIK